MPEAKPPAIVEILKQHFEELAALCELRQAAVGDPDYLPADVAELDERIEAHLDGLVLGGEHSPPLLAEGLGADERPVACAAAYALLHLPVEGAGQQVLDAFAEAKEDRLAGIRDALCRGPLGAVRDGLVRLADAGEDPVALAAAEVLAFRGALAGRPGRLDDWLAHADPLIREAAWRLAAQIEG
jgi:hypothetical protein